jgi:hypothetical protein
MDLYTIKHQCEVKEDASLQEMRILGKLDGHGGIAGCECHLELSQHGSNGWTGWFDGHAFVCQPAI